MAGEISELRAVVQGRLEHFESPCGCHESAEGRLIVVQVWQVQQVHQTAGGELVRQRVSDWPTEQEAEQEVRRLMFGQADGKRQLVEVLESADA